MLPVLTHQQRHDARTGRPRRFGGIALITIGAWLLIARLIGSPLLGLLFLPALGLGVIGWALERHSIGWLVLGGVLLGIGGGAVTASLFASASGTVQSGVFLLAFAVGWLLIALLSGLMDTAVHRWPLIPAGILATFGAILLIGATAPLLAFFAAWWPIGIVAFGLVLLFNRPSQA